MISYRYTVARDGTFKDRRVFAYAGAGLADGKPRLPLHSCDVADKSASAQEYTATPGAMSMLAVGMASTCGILLAPSWGRSFSARHLPTSSLRATAEWSLGLKRISIMRLWLPKERPSRRLSCDFRSSVLVLYSLYQDVVRVILKQRSVRVTKGAESTSMTKAVGVLSYEKLRSSKGHVQLVELGNASQMTTYIKSACLRFLLTKLSCYATCC